MSILFLVILGFSIANYGIESVHILMWLLLLVLFLIDSWYYLKEALN